jgi:hypothetical protein
MAVNLRRGGKGTDRSTQTILLAKSGRPILLEVFERYRYMTRVGSHEVLDVCGFRGRFYSPALTLRATA